MKFVLILALLAGGLLSGQEKPAEIKTDGWEAVNIPVKTLTSEDSFNRLLRLLSVFGNNARVAGDSQLKTISVYAPKEIVTQIRRLVEDLDKPGTEAAIGRNIEVTMTFLRCSVKPPASPPALPAEMESVARQLRAATQCKDVQVWDNAPLHLQEGKESQVNLRLPGTLPARPSATPTVNIRIRPESVSRRDSGRYVRFGVLRVDFRIPVATGDTQFNYMDVGVNTAGDFMEGQKTVLGKVSGMGEDESIFIVIELKVLD